MPDMNTVPMDIDEAALPPRKKPRRRRHTNVSEISCSRPDGHERKRKRTVFMCDDCLHDEIAARSWVGEAADRRLAGLRNDVRSYIGGFVRIRDTKHERSCKLLDALMRVDERMANLQWDVDFGEDDEFPEVAIALHYVHEAMADLIDLRHRIRNMLWDLR